MWRTKRISRCLIDYFGENRKQERPFLPCEIQYYNEKGDDILNENDVVGNKVWVKLCLERTLHGDHTHWMIFTNEEHRYIVVSFRGTQVSNCFAMTVVLSYHFNQY